MPYVSVNMGQVVVMIHSKHLTCGRQSVKQTYWYQEHQLEGYHRGVYWQGGWMPDMGTYIIPENNVQATLKINR